MAVQIRVEIDLEKGENIYTFPDTEAGRRVLAELCDQMNERHLYFYTPHAGSLVRRVSDKEAIMFVNEFLDERAVR